MRRGGLWAVGAVLLCATTARAEMAVEKGKVFTGQEGARIDVVPVKGQAKTVLIRFTGMSGPWNDKVLMHQVNEYGNKTDIKTTYKGRDWVSVAVRESWWQSRNWEVYVPGMRDGVRVAYDEKKTEALNGAEVAKAYEALVAGGELKAIAEFSRKEWETESNGYYAETLKSTNDACGTSLTAKIDWKSVKDELYLKDNLSAYGYCEAPLNALRHVCSDDLGKKAVKEKVKAVTCTWGAKPAVTLEKGALGYTTSKDASNQDDFVKTFLEKKL